MSAICGVVGLDGRRWPAVALAGVAAVLAPHGPDGGGAWTGTAGRLPVTLAALLARRTPEDGEDHQPREQRDREVALVADLRLDNRADLLAALGCPPSAPDSELVLAAYRAWGPRLLERLVGVFALAIVDGKRGGVLLARDALGVRPLVVHERPGVVAFASNALALTEFDGVGHRIDERRAADVIALDPPSDRTFVAGVRWVLPGEAVWVSGEGTRRWSWWRPPAPERSSPSTAVETVREAFDEAVGACLRTVGPVGAELSGGLDSPAVAVTAATRLAPRPLLTCTAVPPPGWEGPTRRGWDAEETPLVEDLARSRPNLIPSFVTAAAGPVFDGRFEPGWELGGGPPRNPCNNLWVQAAAEWASASGVATLLTGERGNLAFSADAPDWVWQLLRSRRLAAAISEAAAWRRLHRRGWPQTLRRLLLPHLAGRERDLRAARWTAARDLAAQADTAAAMEARWGFDRRDPMGDRRVWEAACRLPPWAGRAGGWGRAVARQAMADRLPASVVWRRHKGEQLPEWLDRLTAARPEVAAELAALRDHEVSRRLLDVDRLDALVRTWPDRSRAGDPAVIADYRTGLWRLLVVSRYLRWFEDRARQQRARNRLPAPPETLRDALRG